MKYTVTFPYTAGQLAGVHTFDTARQCNAFVARMRARGVDMTQARIEHSKPPKKRGKP